MKEFLKSMKNSANNVYDKGKVNFEEIIPKLDFNSIWIDGGNSEIFGSPAYSLQLVKVAATMWEKDKKKENVVRTIFAFASSEDVKIEGGYGHEVAELVSKEEVENPQQRVELLRRCLELNLAKEMLGKYVDCKVFIDGSLIAPTMSERKLMDERIIGIVKTSSNVEKSRSLNLMLEKLAPYKSWVVKDLVVSKNEVHNARINFAKLHAKAKIVLRIEGKDIPVNNIAAISADPVFLGYPYPLIKADDLARVSNEERDYHKTKALILAKELGIDLEKEDLVKGSHQILDSVRF